MKAITRNLRKRKENAVRQKAKELESHWERLKTNSEFAMSQEMVDVWHGQFDKLTRGANRGYTLTQ